MNPYQLHQIRMNQPYFQQLPPLINPKHLPVAPQNPQTIYYLPNGNYIIADSVQSDSLACMQPKELDATIANFDNVIRMEGRGEDQSGNKVTEWSKGCVGRRRKRWYVMCVLVTLVVLGVVGGFVGYVVGRQSSSPGENLTNNEENNNNNNNDTNIIPPIDNNKTIDNNNNTNTNNNTSNNQNNNTTNNQNNNTTISNYTIPQSNNNTINNNTTPFNNSNTTTNSTTNSTTNYTGNYRTPSWPNTNQSTNPYPPYTNPNSRQSICSLTPSLCNNISQSIMNYIFSTFNQSNKIRSILQLSQSFNLISSYQPSTSIPLTKKNYTQFYKNITRSVQCMSYLQSGNYNEVYHAITSLQLTTTTQLELYLNMTESFSGQPIKLTNSTNLAQSCQFTLTSYSTSAYRLLQSPTTNYNNSNCVQNQSEVLVYIDGNGYAPNTIVESLKVIQQTLLANNLTTGLGNNVIAMSMWRKDAFLGFMDSIVTGFEQFLAQSSSSIPSRQSTYTALKLLTSMCKNSSYLPQDYTKQTFLKLTNFYTRKIIESLISNESIYETSRHKEFIVQQLNEGKKVVILAHGEGALYANKVFNLLDSNQRQSVGMVFVAPVAKSVTEGAGSYMTNPSDQVIQYLKAYAQGNTSFPLPLAANLNASSFLSQQDFSTNHYLPGYLTSYKQKFIQLISSTRSRILLPTPLYGSGPLTVTLLWDTQPDIDLHIFQPESVHVYYEYKRGASGYFDADDTFMFGPEHYYANCSLKQGNYTVKLNYYSGTAPANVVVTVVAGNQYLVKPMQIYPPLGNAGNSNPPHYVCTVNVRFNVQFNSNQFRIVQ